tara:strand:- start:4635 stop:4934 length:300 start_codon:yes stop_codon:yes gene_type:complete
MSRDLVIKNNDLFINPITGDFLIGDSDAQHVQDIINSWAGWWKEFPTLGVGVKRYLGKSGGVQVIKRAIKIHLKSDGYRTDNIIIKGSEVYITGERVRK